MNEIPERGRIIIVNFEKGMARWAKCDYLVTVSLDRCCNPYKTERFQGRRHRRVKVARVDLEAIERSVLWSLGIRQEGAQAKEC